MSQTTISLDDPNLYNREELAKVLGVKPWFIRRMLAAGFKMPLGRATVRMAHKWMEENGLKDSRQDPPRPSA